MDNLQFIRDAMSRAGQFTAVPGWGGVLMGTTAVVTAIMTSRISEPSTWVRWWLAEAALAIVIAAVTMTRKASRLQSTLFDAPARRFALAYMPPLVAGAVLTMVFAGTGLTARLPGCWLLLYGVAITTGGIFSIRLVQWMGVCFMATGIAAFAAPARAGDVFMAAGFGGLHIIFGVIIARNHGG